MHWGTNSPLSRHIPACTGADPAPPDGHCSGRHASYWNAFLLMKLVRFSLQWRIQVFPGAPTPGGSANLLLPPANVVWGKVMFLHMSVILSTGGSLYDVTSCLAAGGVLCPRRVSVRGWVCVQGVCVQEGLCQEHPTLYDKEQSVRILLKCILVWYNFCRKCMKMNKLD